MKTNVILAALLASLPLAGAARGAAPGDDWSGADRILARIHPPQFPARDFPITDYGASSAPGSDSTAAIARAIAACHAAGGGHVVVPAGFFFTGAIRLLSNVDLHLSEGAVLKFSTDPAAYLPVVFTRWESTECMNYSPFIYALGQDNIALTGPGILDGSANDTNWWAWMKKDAAGATPAGTDAKKLVDMADRGVPVKDRIFGAGYHLRPNFFQPIRCHAVLVSDVTIVNSPMWELNPVLCTDVIARGVKISSIGPNNDGFDPESCKDVLVENCSFRTGDDCIAIKSGRNADGRRVGVPVEDIVIRGCTMSDGHAGVAIGSEISAGCRNVYVEDCRMDSPRLERVLRVKSNATRGGTIENVHLRRIEVGRVAEAILTVDFLYEEGPKGDFPPTVREVHFDDIRCRSTPRVLWIEGFPAATIDQIHFSHCTFAGLDASEIMEHAGRVEFDHVDIIPAVQVRSLSSRPAVW